MAKYLFHANYVGDGVKGLIKDGGTGRRAAVEKLAASVGGRVESFYYAFGDTDLYIIADCPDHAAAVAIALIVNATGSATCKTTVLLTPEEMDAAAKMTPSYTAPGQ